MADANKINENLPSSADQLMRETGRNVSAATDAVRDGVSDAADRASNLYATGADRASELYAAGNAAVANRIDVLPGMVTAALAGVVVGYFIGRDRQSNW
ncbi:hypothetical protein EV667_1546 [Ancylobacter aquaticus]|uniref:Uncharacterized protein n=1 Tax=Ancylobacter aquaticus TaxID=100 RepID=A0A4R1I7P9_ANCAQ|nr:hypothetical protein [Ancylobacter aquaticus]TCK31437.1 hypothetical protein EV667_1546 [Ancylobacter aquaticus]